MVFGIALDPVAFCRHSCFSITLVPLNHCQCRSNVATHLAPELIFAARDRPQAGNNQAATRKPKRIPRAQRHSSFRWTSVATKTPQRAPDASPTRYFAPRMMLEHIMHAERRGQCIGAPALSWHLAVGVCGADRSVSEGMGGIDSASISHPQESADRHLAGHSLRPRRSEQAETKRTTSGSANRSRLILAPSHLSFGIEYTQAALSTSDMSSWKPY